jgi:hypothetical protein
LEQTDVSEVRIASIIRVVMEAVRPLKILSAPTRLHGAKSQKALIFIHAAVKS